MSYLQHRRHDSSQDIDGISFSDLRSTNTSYKPVTSGYEELDLGDERSSLRPIIDRKPVQTPSPTFAPVNPVNGGFLNSAAPRPLPQKQLWRTSICLLLGTLSIPFYVFCGFAWHYHDRPVDSKDQSSSLSSFGNKVRDISMNRFFRTSAVGSEHPFNTFSRVSGLVVFSTDQDSSRLPSLLCFHWWLAIL
jgi:hypothetical protein